MSFTEDLKTGVSPYRKRVEEVIQYLLKFIKNPILGIKSLPDWDYPTLFALLASIAGISGVLSGVVAQKIMTIIAGLIFFPIAAAAGAIVLTGFFYYTFMFVFHKDLPVKMLLTIVILSLMPFFALHIFSQLLEPVSLVGTAATSILLIVGFSEHTHIDRNRLIKLIAGLFIAYFIFWAINLINIREDSRSYKNLATPESIEQLKKEFSK